MKYKNEIINEGNIKKDFGISVESNFSLLLYKKKGDNGLSYYPGENHVVLDLGIVPVSGNTKITLYKPGKKVLSLLLSFLLSPFPLLLSFFIYNIYLFFIYILIFKRITKFINKTIINNINDVNNLIIKIFK